MKKKPLIIIAGPTATGKSAAAVELSKRLSGAVISADSMQVYRTMDIGSAKVTEEEKQGIDHYLIDILDPSQEWNVADFQSSAQKALDKIYSENKLPFVCGGTGFYIQSLLYDIDFETQEEEDREYRNSLYELAKDKGPVYVFEMLKKADPKEAEQNHPNNVKRVVRALEYYHITGKPISEHNEAQRKKESAYDEMFFVLTMDRAKLYERIDKRVDLMINAGLEEEVASLKARGLKQSDVSMHGIGYRQMLDYLDGSISLEEAVYRIKNETRHFSKRQLTWFKREKNAVWIDIDKFDSREHMYDYMEKAIKEHYFGKETDANDKTF